MNCEMLTSPQSSRTNTSPGSISILVIDDDFACLAVVSRMLEGCNYGVCAIRRAIEALSILREREGSIDLVLTDVHMPEMDGFELLARIKDEFEVPVVMMSGDDYEDIMLRALENGAVYYILKPVTVDDLKDLWQFAFVPNNENTVAIEQMGSVRAESTTAAGNVSEENLECESSVNEGSSMQDSNKRASKGKDTYKGKDKDDSSNAKKRRVIWTNELHKKFLEAIDQLGLNKAVPKKILVLMNTPGLTRENIASHLQKYRLFLKKIQEASQCIEPSLARTLAGEFLSSSFALSDPSFMLSTQLRLPQFPELQHSQTVNQQGFGSSIQNLSASVPMASIGRPINYLNQEALTSNPAQLIYSQSLLVSNQGNLQQPFGTAGTPSYLNQGASTSNSTAQLRYGQLFPVSNQGNTQQSFGAAATFNLCSDANNTVFGMEPHHVQMASLLNGDTSRGLMRGRATMQMINQQPQARVGSFASGPLNNFNNMLGFHAQNTFTLGNMGSHGSSNQLQNFNYSNTNYAGVQMASTGDLSGLGRMGSVVGESSHGIDYNKNLLDEIFGGNMPPKSGGNSGYTTQGESSSGGYGSANQFPTSFTNSVNRQQTPPPPPSLQQQECNSFGTGGGDESLFELIKSSYSFGNSRLAKSFDDIDFTNITFSQTNETMDQQDDDEVMDPKLGIGDYEVDDCPQEQP